MYKREDIRMKLTDFNMPNGMPIDDENRWVKMAALIPWDEVEKKYARLFPSKNGNVAIPCRLALGALIIQAKYGFSDRETADQVQMNPYFQYFCGLHEYQMEYPFNASLMTKFRVRLGDEAINYINKLMVLQNQPDKSESTDNSEDGPNADGSSPSNTDNSSPSDQENKGALILDATCLPVNIAYPTDTRLLEHARQSSEVILDELNRRSGEKRPRTYREKARKEYVSFSKNRRPSHKLIRNTIRKQLSYLNRTVQHIDRIKELGYTLPDNYEIRLATVKKLYQQQKYMYDNKTHKIENRIVSLQQPWIRPIVRGKQKNPVEFGPKIEMGIINGFAYITKFSFDNFNESTNLKDSVEAYRQMTGYYPKVVKADQIYRTTDNIRHCKELHIRLSGAPLRKRNPIAAKAEKAIARQDSVDRIEVERQFSWIKRCGNAGLLMTKLQETQKCSAAVSVLLCNLEKIMRDLFLLF
jgi:hypothetical protein